MGRVNNLRLLPSKLLPGQARVRAAFGAMSVENVDFHLAAKLGNAPQNRPIADVGLACHRNTRHAKFAGVLKSAERDVAFGPAGIRIADDSNLGAELSLTEREVMYMSKQAAHGSVQAMQYSEVEAHSDRNLRKECLLLRLSIRTGFRARK